MIVEHKDFLDEDWVKVFLDTFEQSMDSVVITTTSPEEHFLYVNEAFKIKTGYTEADLVGKSPRILQGPQTNRLILDELKETLRNGKNFIGQTTNYRKNGTSYIVRWYISALKNPKGINIAYISYQKEITQSIWNHNQVKLLSSAINQVDQMVLVTDLLGDIVYVNQSFLAKYGYIENEVLHRSVKFLKSDKHSKSFYKDIWQTLLKGNSFHGVFINKHKNSELIMEQKTITPIKNEDGDVEFFVSVGQDITKIMSENDEYKDKAYKDSLTGLYNRFKFDEILARKFKEYAIDNSVFSLIMIDIDNFKNVNDTYGHDKGDDVLKNLAIILQNQLRKNDLLVRWGGEEFTVLIDDTMEQSISIAEKLRLAVQEGLQIESSTVTISIGLTQVMKNDTKESLFKRVDDALYESKNSGKNRVTLL
jgi:diguanylate cyclase (GGDEF)-like protein/PAS domain S-box-containing protein